MVATSEIDSAIGPLASCSAVGLLVGVASTHASMMILMRGSHRLCTPYMHGRVASGPQTSDTISSENKGSPPGMFRHFLWYVGAACEATRSSAGNLVMLRLRDDFSACPEVSELAKGGCAQQYEYLAVL